MQPVSFSGREDGEQSARIDLREKGDSVPGALAILNNAQTIDP